MAALISTDSTASAMSSWRDRTLMVSVGLVAAAALAYQLLLMQLLAVVHWYPFAALIVSLALLGHGVSGSVLCLIKPWAESHWAALYRACALGSALAMPVCFSLAQRLPFNGLALIWEPSQVLWLAALYLLLSLPFFFAASCFGLAFLARAPRIPRIYAADLVGAGFGAALALGLMWILPLEHTLLAIAICAAAAAVLTGGGRLFSLALLTVLALLLLWPGSWLAPQANPYKGLSRTLLLPKARIVAERSSPLGLLQAVSSPSVPLRHVPGLSLLAQQSPPEQIGLFLDGDGLSTITAGSDPDRHAYLGQTTLALPYAVLDAPRVLLLGLGGGDELLAALRQGAREVVVVERNPQIIELLRGPFAAFSGQLLEDPRVQLRIADPRQVLRDGGEGFDLIVFPLEDAAGGVHAAADRFLYTVEAFSEARRQLTPQGLLAFSRYEQLPPRGSLRLLVTVIAAWRTAGVADPAPYLAWISGWQTSTVLAAAAPLKPQRRRRVERFARSLGFSVIHPADSLPAADHSALTKAAQTLLGPGAERFRRDYKFDLSAPVDAQPFFHHFFRWRSLPELWRLRGAGGAVLLDSGYLVLVAALLQALPLALLLIVLPLFALRRGGTQAALAPGMYFLLLGLGFLFVEVAAFSRCSLFLGHPLLAFGVVLATLLIGAGAGSAWAQAWTHRPRARGLALLAVVLMLGCGEMFTPGLLEIAATWPLAARLALCIALLGTLAVPMGMPFPLGLSRLAQETPALQPWAWGINGFASVLGALLAQLLALELGYDRVVWAAIGLYFLAGWVWRTRSPKVQSPTCA